MMCPTIGLPGQGGRGMERKIAEKDIDIFSFE
jgi:hypothetical protein